MKNLLKQSLKKLVDREESRPRGNKDAAVIAVAAQKGGVGKTTTVVNLAAALTQQHGHKTLIIDLDPQGHVEHSLQSLVTSRNGHLSSILESEEDDVDILDVITHTEIKNLDITSGDQRLRETENILSTRIGKEFVLRDALEVTRTWYDTIILDCPPNLGNLTINALTAATHVLIPCDPKPLAIQGVDALIRTCARISDRLNPTVDILGVVVTRYDGRNSAMNQTVLENLEDKYGSAVFDTKIGINTALSKAQDEGTTIFQYDKRSRGSEHYRELADELIQRIHQA